MRPVGDDEVPDLRARNPLRRPLPMWVRITATLVGAGVIPTSVLSGAATWVVKRAGRELTAEVREAQASIVKAQQTSDRLMAEQTAALLQSIELLKKDQAADRADIKAIKRLVSRKQPRTEAPAP